MTWDIVGEILERYGLPMLGLLAVAWAWWKERQANHELNEEVRANSCEMTAALVSVKDVAESFKEALKSIDKKLQDCNRHMDDLATDAHREVGVRIEAVEKKMIELTTLLKK